MIAIIEVGSKQYCVQPNKKIVVNGTVGEPGQRLTYKNLLGSDSVLAEVMAHERSSKVTTRKFRNKTRYHRLKGHRQAMTVLAITTDKAKTKKDSPAEKDA